MIATTTATTTTTTSTTTIPPSPPPPPPYHHHHLCQTLNKVNIFAQNLSPFTMYLSWIQAWIPDIMYKVA